MSRRLADAVFWMLVAALLLANFMPYGTALWWIVFVCGLSLPFFVRAAL